MEILPAYHRACAASASAAIAMHSARWGHVHQLVGHGQCTGKQVCQLQSISALYVGHSKDKMHQGLMYASRSSAWKHFGERCGIQRMAIKALWKASTCTYATAEEGLQELA